MIHAKERAQTSHPSASVIAYVLLNLLLKEKEIHALLPCFGHVRLKRLHIIQLSVKGV